MRRKPHRLVAAVAIATGVLSMQWIGGIVGIVLTTMLYGSAVWLLLPEPD